MILPTHVVIDLADGWTWSKDGDGNPFTETEAHRFCDILNDERKPEHRTFIVATVTPLRSPEFLTVLARDATHGVTELSNTSSNQ